MLTNSNLSKRDLVKGGAALAAGIAMMPGSALSQAVGSSTTASDPFALVHPELRAAAKRMPALPPSFSYSDAVLPKIRPFAATLAKPVLPGISVDERSIAGSKGSPNVTIYIINAKRGESRPAIFHMHGGGFILGSARGDFRDLQEIARALDCVIVTVEYRLAPETRWQGQIEDNYAALKWLHGNAADIGADPARIALYGGSAGGGHAALLAIAARDRGEIPIILQVLIYPMLDDRTGSSHQLPAQFGAIGWRPKHNVYGWTSFLGQEPGIPGVPSAAVPARTQNLSGLPPAFIGVGSIDLFADEDIDYARRLMDVAVPVELIVVPGAFHGFDGIAPEAPVVQLFNASKLNAFRRAFGISVPMRTEVAPPICTGC